MKINGCEVDDRLIETDGTPEAGEVKRLAHFVYLRSTLEMDGIDVSVSGNVLKLVDSNTPVFNPDNRPYSLNGRMQGTGNGLVALIDGELGNTNWQTPGAGGGIDWSDPVDASITVGTNFTYDLGTAAAGFKDVYAERYFLNGEEVTQTAVTLPSGNLVGDSDTQTLTNKTLTDVTITGFTVTGQHNDRTGTALTMAATDASEVGLLHRHRRCHLHDPDEHHPPARHREPGGRSFGTAATA